MNIGAMEQVTQEAIRRDRAELSRIRTLLGDRDRIAAMLEQAAFSDWIPNGKKRWLAMADKLRSYLLSGTEGK